MVTEKNKKIIFVAIIFFILSAAFDAQAVNSNEVLNFYVDKDFDASERTQIAATMVKTAPKLYFYIEKNWWDLQLQPKRAEILNNLDILSQEFENRIYPMLTSVFGSEWKPGVDGDDRITVLFQSMKEDVAGYFRPADEYIKLQLPESNEKEMLYLSLSHIDSPQLKVFLSHEFVHLIAFNQKERISGKEEEVWLNEARADYSLNILGYDDQYEGSNLQRRIKAFLEKPSDSLTEWQGKKHDYGVTSLFTYYMIDHYGINVLIDSLKSKLAGIPSINYALQKNEIEGNFSQIFTDWTIAVVLNDCSLGPKYCYLNKNLKNFRISPNLNFLPLTGDSSLSVTNVTKNWSGSWQKIIGGNGKLKLEFSSSIGLDFRLPYIIEDKNGKYLINFLVLDKNKKGEIDIEKFGSQIKSLVIIPSLQTKTSGFDGLEFTYPFTFTILIAEAISPDEQATIKKLLDQIDYLKKEIAKFRSCSQLNSNLYFGMLNNNEVRCLQEFLKSQSSDIYPEKLITGYFGNLTKLAVIRFQEKYSPEILTSSGLRRGTGYVGFKTRQKINRLISGT
ncbi:MAG: hypothetical protein CEN87_229 [Parcubacteria group bacterium Licking1014_1]|nr:MAG: hypothetical protein CEN87_229 [Parcubacteria group bacterium Licking1014_1]